MHEHEHEKLSAAKYSVFANLFIIIIKLAVGLYTGSLGILADSLHSVFDLAASFFAYFGIKKASEPSDKTHHYGHERFENLSSIIQSILLGLTSVFILYEAHLKFEAPNYVVRESFLGIAVMVITLIIDVKISAFLHKKSKETNSAALEADAFHFTTDMYSAIAVIVGLGATAIGYPLADIAGAVVVALIMLYVAVNIAKESTFILLDQAPSEEILGKISTVISKYPGILAYHSLRGRLSGRKIFIDVSVHLKSDISLTKAHKIAEELEIKIIEKCPDVKEVIIHMEPDEEHDLDRTIKLKKH
ncbi:cation transporter [Candidatus Micrarchaeota archaeon]|nr:cation transporter [Candidatus Micrarchaeota archaeon]